MTFPSILNPGSSLHECKRPLFEVEVHQAIRSVLLVDAVDLRAMLTEGGIAALEGYLAKIRHWEPQSQSGVPQRITTENLSLMTSRIGGLDVALREISFFRPQLRTA